ncbi:MAG: leucine-rich repeat protein [Ruminococcus sp.]
MRIGKRLLAAVAAGVIFAVSVPWTVSAVEAGESGTYGDLVYDVLDNGTIEIMFCDEAAVEVEIPSEIDGLPVTSIASSTFLGCSSLTSVTIPDSVTSIGTWAFEGCTSLSSIVIPDSVTYIGNFAFDYTPWLAAKQAENPLVIVNGILIDGKTCSGDITIPDGVTKISAYSFQGCTSLISIAIPKSMETIGLCAFVGCSSLTSVYITDLEAWCNIDFECERFTTCFSNPLYYAENFYINNDNKTDIVIPSGIEYVKDYVFYGYKGLASITIPESVIHIGEGAFSGCTGLNSVEFSEGVESIGKEAFYNCSNLTSIDMPDSVTQVGEDVFGSCKKLERVRLSAQLTEIPDYTGPFSGGFFAYCGNLKEVYIPKSITYIGHRSFYNTTCPSGDFLTAETFYYTGVIYYAGTEEDWNTIEIAEEACLVEAATIYYEEVPQTTTTTEITETTTTATTTIETTLTESNGSSTFNTPANPDILYGDTNLDGRVDITDAVLLNKAAAGAVTLNDRAAANADCNGNSELGNDDALILLKFLVHLVSTLPCNE